jgi:Zn ribbon nucleic-acid-binding protein
VIHHRFIRGAHKPQTTCGKSEPEDTVDWNWDTVDCAECIQLYQGKKKFMIVVAVVPWKEGRAAYQEKFLDPQTGALWWAHETITAHLARERYWKQMLMAAFYSLMGKYREKFPVSSVGGAFLEAPEAPSEIPLDQPDTPKPKTGQNPLDP